MLKIELDAKAKEKDGTFFNVGITGDDEELPSLRDAIDSAINGKYGTDKRNKILVIKRKYEKVANINRT